MAWVPVSVSGEGLHTFVPWITPLGVYVDVTSLGVAERRDDTDPCRYLHIGWFAMVDTDPDIPNGIAGDFLHEVIFIPFQKSAFERIVRQDATTGITGFRYVLLPGVNVTFHWWV